jgi:hypothetical protein
MIFLSFHKNCLYFSVILPWLEIAANRKIIVNTTYFYKNHYFAFGGIPPCLLNLSQEELALITSICTFGYCFSYTGGHHKQLKGVLSYYKIPNKTIVTMGAQLEQYGLNNHFLIILYGSMILQHLEKATSKYKIVHL